MLYFTCGFFFQNHLIYLVLLWLQRNFLTYMLHLDCSSPYSHSSQVSPLPLLSPVSTPLPFLFKQTNKNNHNKKSRPGISTKHSITNYNKTGHKPSYQDWTGWSSRRKRLPRAGKSIWDIYPPTLLGVPQEYQAIQPQRTCRESSSDPHRICHCRFSLYKLQWSLLCWFCGSSSHGLLDPSGS